MEIDFTFAKRKKYMICDVLVKYKLLASNLQIKNGMKLKICEKFKKAAESARLLTNVSLFWSAIRKSTRFFY